MYHLLPFDLEIFRFHCLKFASFYWVSLQTFCSLFKSLNFRYCFELEKFRNGDFEPHTVGLCLLGVLSPKSLSFFTFEFWFCRFVVVMAEREVLVLVT